MRNVHRIERNLRACFRALAAQRPGAECRQVPGAEIISLGVQFQMFNAIFLTDPVEIGADLDRRIAHAIVFFGERRLPWSFWLCDGFLSPQLVRKAAVIFERRGLQYTTEMPGMIARSLAPPDRPLPEIELRELGPAERAEFRNIGAFVFRVPPPWFAEVFDERMLERPGFHALVAYSNGHAIGCAATVASEDVTGIYNLAILPEHRGQGFGEAIMRQLLPPASLPAVLQSTARGLRLYERLGFEAITRFRVWVS